MPRAIHLIGIESPGLWAGAEAFADMADLLVVAPRQQQSGMGRSFPVTSEGRIYEEKHVFIGVETPVYAVVKVALFLTCGLTVG